VESVGERVEKARQEENGECSTLVNARLEGVRVALPEAMHYKSTYASMPKAAQMSAQLCWRTH
jgi:hypothetical protein